MGKRWQSYSKVVRNLTPIQFVPVGDEAGFSVPYGDVRGLEELVCQLASYPKPRYMRNKEYGRSTGLSLKGL